MSRKSRRQRQPSIVAGVAQPAQRSAAGGAQRGQPVPKPPVRQLRLPSRPVLRFSPTAWAKLRWFCLHGETEIGGFAITDPSDSLYVVDFVTVKQDADWASIKFDDAAVADFFDSQVDLGRKPEQFARIWCHTHPGDSPTPSCVDEDCFVRVFGKCQWAVMFVLARTGQTYARLRFNIGPGGHVMIPVEVDWTKPFSGADHAAWLAEFAANIQMHQSALADLTHFGRDDSGFSQLVFDSPETGQGQTVAPDDVFGAQELAVDELDLNDEWIELFDTTDWKDLEEAANTVCIRWGLTDGQDWQDILGGLDPTRQHEFFEAVKEIIYGVGAIKEPSNG
jgi:hypothetical protein